MVSFPVTASGKLEPCGNSPLRHRYGSASHVDLPPKSRAPDERSPCGMAGPIAADFCKIQHELAAARNGPARFALDTMEQIKNI